MACYEEDVGAIGAGIAFATAGLGGVDNVLDLGDGGVAAVEWVSVAVCVVDRVGGVAGYFFGISLRVMRKKKRRRDWRNLTICGCGCGCAKDGGGYRLGIGWCDGLSDRARDDVC